MCVIKRLRLPYKYKGQFGIFSLVRGGVWTMNELVLIVWFLTMLYIFIYALYGYIERM